MSALFAINRRLRLSIVAFIFVAYASAQQAGVNLQPLPRSTPEAQGISSRSILDFIEAADRSNNEFHSFMFIRHGKVIAEGWWNPYRADLKHTMYSVSKSFTATAIGFAVTEKRITVDDPVIRFFPKDLPDTVSQNLARLKIKDLLSMSVGQEPEPSGISRDTNWVRGFLAASVVHTPGSTFLYNSMATYMLSAIVQKVTGMKVLDYLKPRLFVPLGISNVDWETDPKGINVGGWGFRIRTEDLAKFGQLFLQQGKWKGKQILPASWIEEASTMKIMQNPNATPEARATSDWLQGYGYQMWRCRNNAYRGDGAFGQYIIVFPEHDAVIAITSETSNMQDELNLVYKFLLPAMQSRDTVFADKNDQQELTKKLRSLSLPALKKVTDSAFINKSGSRTYQVQANPLNIRSLKFSFAGDNCQLAIKNDTATHIINFGSGVWKTGTTTKKGPSLTTRAKNHFVGLPAPKIAASYHWLDGRTMELELRYVESPHTEKYKCTFNDQGVLVEVTNSFEKDRTRVVLTGSL